MSTFVFTAKRIKIGSQETSRMNQFNLLTVDGFREGFELGPELGSSEGWTEG